MVICSFFYTKKSIPKAIIFRTKTKLHVAKTENGDLQTLNGTIHMLDYMAQKPMILHAKVHIKKCPGSSQIIVFYKLSPKPFTAVIWLKLNALWAGFKCSG